MVEHEDRTLPPSHVGGYLDDRGDAATNPDVSGEGVEEGGFFSFRKPVRSENLACRSGRSSVES